MQIPRLRRWRERQGLTQKELADLAGVSPRSIAGYEGGDGTRPNTARKLADALGVAVADLMEEEISSPKAEPLSLEWALDPRVGDEEFRGATAEASDEIIRELERQLFQQYQRAPNDRAWATGKPPKLRTPLVRERLRALRQPPYAVITWRGEGPAEVRWLVPEDEREALRPKIEESLRGENYVEIGPGDPATTERPPERSMVLA